MGTKRTEILVETAKRLRSQGMPLEEIAATLSKHGKTISKATVFNWLRTSPDPNDAPKNAPAPASEPKLPLAEPAEPAEPGAELTPEELRQLLSDELKRYKHEADAARARQDEPAARQASKMFAIVAGHLRQIHAKQDADEADVVRVKAGDVEAAAERALTGLRQLADRVVAERATWPRCTGCGQPHGRFGDGDKSPLRALFERVVSGG